MIGKIIEGIECDIEDYRIVYVFFIMGVLGINFLDIFVGIRIFYEGVRKFCREQVLKEKLEVMQVIFIKKQIFNYIGFGGEFVKKYL